MKHEMGGGSKIGLVVIRKVGKDMGNQGSLSGFGIISTSLDYGK